MFCCCMFTSIYAARILSASSPDCYWCVFLLLSSPIIYVFTIVVTVQSQPICLSVYNTTLLGLINLAIYFILDDKIGVVVGASTLTAVAGSIFTISVLFGPKVYRVSWRGVCGGSCGAGCTVFMCSVCVVFLSPWCRRRVQVVRVFLWVKFL